MIPINIKTIFILSTVIILFGSLSTVAFAEPITPTIISLDVFDLGFKITWEFPPAEVTNVILKVIPDNMYLDIDDENYSEGLSSFETDLFGYLQYINWIELSFERGHDLFYDEPYTLELYFVNDDSWSDPVIEHIIFDSPFIELPVIESFDVIPGNESLTMTWEIKDDVDLCFNHLAVISDNGYRFGIQNSEGTFPSETRSHTLDDLVNGDEYLILLIAGEECNDSLQEIETTAIPGLP